ncbi:hypothetical protein T07_8052 [Trichinella nelsoni]|uniref:Uncharacterized protein n=1 Tax=Trichinella nelsoni TaxID=6336 RepID=A0A0V0RGZ8_9BILA|nr:hypothetical protein T07_8052 [Trichinella nelsoni]
MSELQAGQSPSVAGKVNGLEISLLLDSGAVVSVVSLSAWRKATGGEPFGAAKGSILLDDWRKVRLCGQGVWSLQIGNCRGRIHVAVVESLVVPGILVREITMTDGSRVEIKREPAPNERPSIGCALVRPNLCEVGAGKTTEGKTDMGDGDLEEFGRFLVNEAECSARSRRVQRKILRKCGKAILCGAQPVKLPPRPLPQALREVDSNIRLLAASRTWGMDGTFKIVPQCPDTRDSGLLPEYEVQDCYFHFCQAVHRKVGELGLKTRNRTEEQTKRKIRMLLATAFLPVPQVDMGVSLLEAGTTGNLLALFQYFRQEWMTNERLPLWNVHNVNIRTNNYLKDWHNRLNRKAGKKHNGFYELLQLLIAEQGVMDTLIQQVLLGNVTVGDLRRVNRVYAQKQRRVAQYTGECTNGRRTLEQFLEALMYITPEPI